MSDTAPVKNVPVQGDPEMKGWLFKWTNYLKGYQRRWFVLSNGVLSYYRYIVFVNGRLLSCQIVPILLIVFLSEIDTRNLPNCWSHGTQVYMSLGRIESCQCRCKQVA